MHVPVVVVALLDAKRNISMEQVPERGQVQVPPQRQLSGRSDPPPRADGIAAGDSDIAEAGVADAVILTWHAAVVSGYVPAPQLTERPRVLHEAVPEWTLPPLGTEVDCLLLINEHGDVDRVLFEHAMLEPARQQALRERLMSTRFLPGSLYGRQVKTALRISVRLD